jgi:hybrid cluster-associated redox disulfide protein
MANKITENTTIFEALQINPNAGDILMSYGMHCLGCALAHGETVGEAAEVHGADLEKMLEELNAIEG